MYRIIGILKRPDGVSMEANWTPHFPVLLPVVSFRLPPFLFLDSLEYDTRLSG